MTELEPVRVIFRGFRVSGRKQREYDGILPSVNDIGVSGRDVGSGFNPVYANAKALYAPVLSALLTEPSGTEYEFIKPGTATTKVIVPIERDGELPASMAAVLVEGTCWWPDARLRDQGNFVTILVKFLGDVLVDNHLLDGGHDDWTRFQFGNLTRGLDRNHPPYTELVLLPRLERFELLTRDTEGALF